MRSFNFRIIYALQYENVHHNYTRYTVYAYQCASCEWCVCVCAVPETKGSFWLSFLILEAIKLKVLSLILSVVCVGTLGC